MSDALKDIVSNEVIVLKSSLGTLVEIVETWVLATGGEDERRRRLTDLQTLIGNPENGLSERDRKSCRQHIDALFGKPDDNTHSSLAFRQKLQKLFKDQIERIHLEVDKLLNHIGRILDGLSSDSGSASGIILAQEEERKRISREIHDGPAQIFASLTMRVDYCIEQIKRPDILRTELTELKESITRSLKDIRRFIFDLRPMALDDLGLIPTIEQFISGFKKRTALNIHLSVEGERRPLASDSELAVFRVIQEAVNNAHHHAQAKTISVFLCFDHQSNKLSAVVKDDGVGFDYAKVKKNYASLKKLGLLSMEERIRLAKGRFELVSSQGEGAVISFWVPLLIREGA